MTQTITLKIWNQEEGKITKKVEIPNVLSVNFETKFNEILFLSNHIEIFIGIGKKDIEFNFSEDKKYVFITIKDSEEQ